MSERSCVPPDGRHGTHQYAPFGTRNLKRTVAIVLYPGFTTLDALGTWQVLAHASGVEAIFVSQTRCPVASADDYALTPAATLDGVPSPDVVVVPGGVPSQAGGRLVPPITAWLRRVHGTTTWTAALAGGRSLLVAAGILPALEARGAGPAGRDLAFARPRRGELAIFGDRHVVVAGESAGIALGSALIAWLPGARFQASLTRTGGPPAAGWH